MWMYFALASEMSLEMVMHRRAARLRNVREDIHEAVFFGGRHATPFLAQHLALGFRVKCLRERGRVNTCEAPRIENDLAGLHEFLDGRLLHETRAIHHLPNRILRVAIAPGISAMR